ncbi:hypothetical protein HY625_00060 [Candidatus Uhrbacteria bacterium]|nr:hypothetical protein [Candidatus Uhrbacteria bacterium]
MERKTFWEVVLVAGLGGGIATVAASAVGFPWWPAVILGAGIGAFLCFRPQEIYVAVSEEVKHRGGMFSRLSLWRPSLPAVSMRVVVCRAVYVFWISVSIATGLLFGNLCEMLVRFYVAGWAVIVFLLMGIIGGCCWALFSAIATGVRSLQQRPNSASFPLLRITLGFMDDYKNVAGTSAPTFAGDIHELVSSVGWTVRGIAELLCGSVVVIFVIPICAVFGLAFLLDCVATAVFLLVSKPRLAVMWGTMIGGTVGYCAYLAHPGLPVATFVGMLAGGASGGALYSMRARIVVALQKA